MTKVTRRYQEMVEHSLGLICIHDLEGRLLFVNPAAARSVGYPPGDWIGRNLRDIVIPEARPKFDEYLRRMHTRTEDSGLMRVIGRDGQVRIWTYHNVRSEAPDEPPYVVGHALDITERVLAEEAVRRSREELQASYLELDERVRARTAELEATANRLRGEMTERRRAEAMREAVMVRERNTLAFLATASDQLTRTLDEDATLTTLARLPVPFLADWTTLHAVGDDGQWRCLGGFSREDRAARMLEPLRALPPHIITDATLVARAAASRAIQVHQQEEGDRVPALRRVYGEGHLLAAVRTLPCQSVAVAPLVIDERLIAVLVLSSANAGRYHAADLAIIEDLVRRGRMAVTQVRLYREAQDANRLKDEFLATLSHELRTPLNAILGWARILRSRSLDDKAEHAVQVIERNAEAQTRLIEDVLDVSRIITGKLTLEVAAVPLATVIVAALDSIRPAAYAKGIRLTEQLQPASVNGDRHRLQQVIWNLLSNAVKFTNSGGSVTVTLRGGLDTVEIAVSDTGVGIRRDVLPFVFDRFRQADPSTTRSQGGLGLGLAIVRHLVELHGGSVRVRSVFGQGTTFLVELPVRGALEPATGSGQMVLGGDLLLGVPEQRLRGVSALVVDDHEDARELATAVLNAAGAHVSTAASVAEALERIAASPVDVLVADIGLPGADGYELIRRVRQQETADRRRLVAVALTGYARAEDRTRALDAGFDRHVVKPVDPGALVMVLRELLDRG